MEIREIAVEAGKFALFGVVGGLFKGLTKGDPLLINGAVGVIEGIAFRALDLLINYLAEEKKWKISSVWILKSVGLGLIMTISNIALFAFGVVKGPKAIVDTAIGLFVPISGLAYGLYLKYKEGDLDFITAKSSNNFMHQVIVA